jgi:AcrR family transcriptional regulator
MSISGVLRMKRKSLKTRKKEIFFIISKIIEKKGFCNVSTVEVAKELGVSQPAIYKYFKNKDEMIIYFLDNLKEMLFKIIEKTDKKKTFWEKIDVILEDHLTLIEKTKIIPRVVFSDMVYSGDKKREKLQEVIFSYWKEIEKIFQEAVEKKEIKEIDAKFGVKLIIGLILSNTLEWMLSNMEYSLKQEKNKILNQLKKILIS